MFEGVDGACICIATGRANRWQLIVELSEVGRLGRGVALSPEPLSLEEASSSLGLSPVWLVLCYPKFVLRETTPTHDKRDRM